MGIRGSSTVPIFFENSPVPKENLLHEIGRGPHCRIQHFECRTFLARRLLPGRIQRCLKCVVEIFERAHGVRQTSVGFRLHQNQARRNGHSHLRNRVDDLPLGRHDRGSRGEFAVRRKMTSEQEMQVLEEYAIESSISKVAGSETLDYCVDEGVQIFGGYGFHEDYPVARPYRDSRVNRIFEGTNEINRMLIIQMLMKRAMADSADDSRSDETGDEVLAGPLFEESPSGAFAEEERSLAQAKKIFLLAAGTAVQKFRENSPSSRKLWPLSRHCDGCLRDGIVLCGARKKLGRARGISKRDGRRREGIDIRRSWITSRKKRVPLCGHSRRRHTCHAIGCATPLCKACSRSTLSQSVAA